MCQHAKMLVVPKDVERKPYAERLKSGHKSHERPAQNDEGVIDLDLKS
jgi:hypothetical protein